MDELSPIQRHRLDDLGEIYPSIGITHLGDGVIRVEPLRHPPDRDLASFAGYVSAGRPFLIDEFGRETRT